LRTYASLLQVVAVVTLLGGLIGSIVAVVNYGGGTGATIGVIGAIASVVTCVALLALAPAIHIFAAIEQNTRDTSEILDELEDMLERQRKKGDKVQKGLKS
jgi:hypothetical protein